MEQDPRRKKKGQKQAKKQYLTPEEAKEYKELYIPEEMDQYVIVLKLLQYALLIIDSPKRLPEWGYIRLFSDIYNEHKALNWGQLTNRQLNNLEDSIHRYNQARSNIDFSHRKLLEDHGILLYKLQLCPERE